MDYKTINQAAWDKRTRVHVTSRFYDVEGFLAGNSTLTEIETAELKDIAGKSLLHLQCHFGLDTLSWARLDAKVTGVDLSPAAIKQANQLKDKAELNAEFICADVYDFGANNTTQYDIVFTSFGAICWLPDINLWAETVASALKPGGQFYMAEFHPIYDLVAGYDYFHRDQADVDEEGTYTENCNGETSTLMTWGHPLSDVINALIQAGIMIEQLNEFPFSPYNCFENMEQREPGRFYLQHQGKDMPLIYSIKGTKVA
ncbi:class I SAM-dependent methyltransferase [Endozoicomonadaceae bacterium StTr2]